jgi:hypothetical protein
MNPNQQTQLFQQNRISHYAKNADSYQFFNLLTSDSIFNEVEALLPVHRERLFPPTETLSMFLAQVLNADRSCQNIVDDTAVKRLLGGLPLCSTRTGAYCRARKRLPLRMVSSLSKHVSDLCSRELPSQWCWHDRPVKLVDGTTLSMPDTPANQEVYPQPASQKPGLGFPLCRFVGLVCLGSGAVLNAAMRPNKGKGNDEQSMLRSMLDTLNTNDVLLGDAYYATYFLFCALQTKGVDGVFEQHGSRRKNVDFSSGVALGKRDHLIQLDKPKRPSWMSKEDYEQAPNSLTLRELKTGGKVIITSLVCPNEACKTDIKALYRQRWNIELDLRNIKTTLGMDILSCCTPEMIEKEVWVYLLAYNLIRLLMCQSASLVDILPRQISFKHALQIWLAWRNRAGICDEAEIQCLLHLIAQQQVGDRSGRIEPRALKRRPKQFSLLRIPRAEARAQIRINGHPKKLK